MLSASRAALWTNPSRMRRTARPWVRQSRITRWKSRRISRRISRRLFDRAVSFIIADMDMGIAFGEYLGDILSGGLLHDRRHGHWHRGGASPNAQGACIRRDIRRDVRTWPGLGSCLSSYLGSYLGHISLCRRRTRSTRAVGTQCGRRWPRLWREITRIRSAEITPRS